MVGEVHLDEQMLRKLVDVSAAAILLTDSRGVIEYVNRRFCEVSGYDSCELLGKNPAILNSGRTPKSLHQELWRNLKKGLAWRGRILNRKKGGDFYWSVQSITPIQDEQGTTTQYLSISDDASEIIELAANESDLSFYDELTGVGNSRLFDLDLVAELEKVDRACLMLGVVELNNSELNDSFLTVTASRLIALAGHAGSVYRLSERRFAVLLTASPWAVRQFGLEASVQLSCPLDHVFDSVYPKLSIGYARWLPGCGQPSELLWQAEHALTEVKKGAVQNSPEGDVSSNLFEQLDDRQLLFELQRALDANELSLAAQPIFQLDDSRLAAFEFLLRWRHPQYGYVTPLRIIEVAEKFGYLYPVAEKVLALLLHQLTDELVDNAQVSFTLNLNLPQITNRKLMRRLLFMIDSSGVERSRFIFEVTETDELPIDPCDAGDTFDWLRREGVLLALDDFGTGYSTLDYLNSFPMDLVKLDRSLVKDIHSHHRRRLTLKKMLELCQDLGVVVVVEGVEVEADHCALKDMGIAHLLVQGYYYARPTLLGDAENICELKVKNYA